jgi:hypothetical protein
MLLLWVVVTHASIAGGPYLTRLIVQTWFEAERGDNPQIILVIFGVVFGTWMGVLQASYLRLRGIFGLVPAALWGAASIVLCTLVSSLNSGGDWIGIMTLLSVVLGFSQTIILWRYFHHQHVLVWFPANIVGWRLGWWLGNLLNEAIAQDLRSLTDPALTASKDDTVAALIMGTVTGIVTGAALEWILYKKRSSPEPLAKPSPATPIPGLPPPQSPTMPPVPGGLAPADKRTLVTMLEQAFPTLGDLEELTNFSLGVSLDRIRQGDDNAETAILRILNYCEKHSDSGALLNKLLCEAAQERPARHDLKAFLAQRGVECDEQSPSAPEAR